MPIRRLCDHGCRTNFPKAQLWINSMGEIGRRNDCLAGYPPEIPAAHPLLQLNPDACDRSAAQRAYEYSWLKSVLSGPELRLWSKVRDFQAVADSERFRVYGELRKVAFGELQPVICLVTEFKHKTGDALYWAYLNELSQRLSAQVWFMQEWMHTHERQVELSWRVETLSTARFKKYLEELRLETQLLWDAGGIGTC